MSLAERFLFAVCCVGIFAPLVLVLLDDGEVSDRDLSRETDGDTNAPLVPETS